MKFLFDESVDAPIAVSLSQLGHEVFTIWELEPGITDDEVLNKANDVGALLVTADKDFGELVFRLNRLHHGIILLRLAGLSMDRKVAAVTTAIREHGDAMRGAFTVVTPTTMRIRKTTIN